MGHSEQVNHFIHQLTQVYNAFNTLLTFIFDLDLDLDAANLMQ